MNGLVNDKQTYEELKRDPTPALQRKLNSKLLKLKKTDAIDIRRYYRLRCPVPQPPKLYGLPKLHKPNIPMRPIVSFCGSPTYQLSKYLTTVLQPLTDQSVTTATIPYIKGTSETIARILQPYNIRVAHKPITTLRQLLTNVKDKDEPNDRQGAVYKIKCCDCQATYIGETGRNLNTRLTEHKRATRNGDLNNNIAEHHLQTDHRIDWDSAECVIYSTDYYQRLTLESWFTNLEQTPLNRCQQLPAPYKRLLTTPKQTNNRLN